MANVTYRLTKQIPAHGESLTELTFREPTGKDVRLCGFPLRIDGEGGFVDAAMSRMIGQTAGIPPSSVDMLSMTDWLGAAAVVAGFLGKPGPTSSTDTSTPPSSSTPT